MNRPHIIDASDFDTDGHPFRPIVLHRQIERHPRAYYEGLAAHVRKIERRERLATFFRSQRGRFQIACILTAMLSAGYVGSRFL